MGLFDGAFSGVGSALIGAAGNIAGGLLSGGFQPSSGDDWARNYAAQKEFAQNGIRWRVEDAKAAGLHPLAALGATSSMFSPTASYDGGAAQSDYSWLGAAGQNLGRAIDAGLTKEERVKQQMYREQDMQLNLENKQLQNDMLKHQLVSQVAKDAIASNEAVIGQQRGPAMPTLTYTPNGTSVGQTIPGQGDSYPTPSPFGALVTPKPAEPTATNPGQAWSEAGSYPEVAFYTTSDGGLAPQITQSLSEPYESDAFGRWAWNWRNRVSPAIASFTMGLLGSEHKPPLSLLPDKEATDWRYDYLRGAYYPYYPKRKNAHGLARF